MPSRHEQDLRQALNVGVITQAEFDAMVAPVKEDPKEMIACPVCTFRNPAGTQKCNLCGSQLVLATKIPPPPPPTQSRLGGWAEHKSEGSDSRLSAENANLKSELLTMKTKFEEAEAKKNAIERKLRSANDLLSKSTSGERSKDSEIRTLKRTNQRREREMNVLKKKASQLDVELRESRASSIEKFIYEACQSNKDIADLWVTPSRVLGTFDFRGSATEVRQAKRTLVSIMTSTLRENRDAKDKISQLQQELADTRSQNENPTRVRDPRELRETKQKVIDLAKQLEEARRGIQTEKDKYDRASAKVRELSHLATSGGGGNPNQSAHADPIITALAARCYDLGLGVQQNKEHAKRLYGGISRPDLDSMFKGGFSAEAFDGAFLMAEMLDFERVSFVRTSTREHAINLYTYAAEAGHAAAQNALGNCYEMGEGVPKDLAAAEKWYAQAADQGNPLALRNLAKMHEEGLGVPRDPATASQLYAACVLAL